jgi:acyl carrier protein
LVVLTVVAGVIYFSTPDSTPTPKSASPTPAQQSTDAAGTPASPTRSTYSAGVQYGQNIESGAGTGYQFTACTKEGISCLGENAISDKTISIPLQKGTDWSRIAVLITFTEPGNMAQIVVSTTSDAVGLNYADHRDGMFHKQVEFQSEYPEAISKTERPLWYPVDILFRNPVEKFPLTITVKEDDQPAHSVTTYLKVLGLSAPSAQKANPNPTTQRATPTATTAPESSSELVAKPTERKITIADRVTVIIAHQLSLSAGKLKPEDDFEMDLGASPTEVTLIMYDLQTEYEILIPKSDAMKIKTVGEAIEYIEQREK